MNEGAFVLLSVAGAKGYGEVVREGVKAWKGRKLQGIVCRLALGATVYNIWMHRNSNRVNSEEQIFQHIC